MVGEEEADREDSKANNCEAGINVSKWTQPI